LKVSNEISAITVKHDPGHGIESVETIKMNAQRSDCNIDILEESQTRKYKNVQKHPAIEHCSLGIEDFKINLEPSHNISKIPENDDENELSDFHNDS
jgi:hypothetical protein